MSTVNPRAIQAEPGRAIIAFEQARDGASIDIFAQAVDDLGNPLWGDTGVSVCTTQGDQKFALHTFGALAPDGQGGCYIVWEDPRLPSNGYDVFIQHLTRAGTVAAGWPVNGFQLTNQTGDQKQASVVSDDAGGAIVVWEGAVPFGATDIFASRVTAACTLATGWDMNGNVVCEFPSNEVEPVLTKDGASGAIIAWADDRGANIFAQRMLGNGSPAWLTDGVRLSTATLGQSQPEITTNEAGGAFVVWKDNRTPATAPDVYAQHITSSGVLAGVDWPEDGLAISTEMSDQAAPLVIPDETGGMITCWDDRRNFAETRVDIYAQRVTAGGSPLWTAGGLAVCDTIEIQDQPAIAPDGYGGAVVAWRDFRINQTFGSIFAQRVDHGGELGSMVSVGGGAPRGVISVVASPNPARQVTRIVVGGAQTEMKLTISDVAGRVIRTFSARSNTNGERQEIAWDLCDRSGRRVSPGLYLVRAQSREGGGGTAQGALVVLR